MRFPEKIGILGGGQLGKMLCIAGAEWHLPLYVMDTDPDFPAGRLCHTFTCGHFNHYDDVVRFGKDKDLITIEIEHVDTEALLYLKSLGVAIHPDPAALAIIKDKGLQKEFYRTHGLPTAAFEWFDGKSAVLEAVQSGRLSYPFVQKSRSEGYDGKGVAVIWDPADLDKLLDCPCLVEKMVDIHKEIAVIVARNGHGEISAYPPVEMLFHPEANLVEFLLCPAQILPSQAEAAIELAKKTIQAFDICGLLAVELFLTTSGDWLINEVAPRPHNSGHHTIESCTTSQFQQHWRGILQLPLGSTSMKTAYGVMINLLGSEGFSGPPVYRGWKEAIAIPGVHVHLYGKPVTKPFRKMGHVTITGHHLEEVMTKAVAIKQMLSVEA